MSIIHIIKDYFQNAMLTKAHYQIYFYRCYLSDFSIIIIHLIPNNYFY